MSVAIGVFVACLQLYHYVCSHWCVCSVFTAVSLCL